MILDKIFKAYDVRATYPHPLSDEAGWKVGHGTGLFLKRSRANLPANQKVRQEDLMVVGRDMRPSSVHLAHALIEGIRMTGMRVYDIGICDTSMVYFAINHEDAVGGVMVTASHNPVQYNGFKISGPKARPIGAASGLGDIKRIAGVLTHMGKTGLFGKVDEKDLWGPYKEHVRRFLDLKRPMRVAVDASNGMAGKMVPAIFGDVPGLEIVPLLFEITGSFVHEPNPLVEKNLEMLRTKVRQSGAELGVCFDGDADRCIFVDETGRTVGCDLVTALLARDFLERPENAGGTVVYDLRSSHVVPEEIAAAGGEARRERVGHAFMKKTMAETQAVFGGELSGHFYFRDNFYADSGAIAFAKVLSVLSERSEKFSEVVAPLRRYSHSGEINFQVEDKKAKARELAEAHKKGQVDYLDGVTVEFDDWWFNVRESNTEPLLRLNVEAKTPQALEQRLKELKRILGEPAEGH